MNKKDLIAKIKLANDAYARGYPFMTDSDYDILWAQLHAIAPNHPVLFHTANNTSNINAPTLPHAYPVKGTNKAFVTEDLKPFMARFGHTQLLLQPKYDGCAVMLYKQAEGTFQLLLEGNGSTGRDVTHHLSNFKLPKNLRSVNSMEAIIYQPDWDRNWGANPRNTLAGWLNRDIFPPHNPHLVLHNGGEFEEEYFFDGNYDYLTELLLTLYNTWKKSYPLDGIMIKVKDEELRLRAGDNGTSYNWSIAWKPPISTAETTVTKVEWNVSRRGRIVPTVFYELVKLCGSKNIKVTGNNAQWLADRLIDAGTTIVVGKSGEIIPKIVEVVKGEKKTNVPEKCPICKSPLIFKNNDLFCEGKKCLPQVMKSLEYFYSDKGMDLKQVGPKMFHALLDIPLLYQVLSEHPYALLDLDGYGIKEAARHVFGPALYERYKKSLAEINNKKTVINFITSLGKEGLGYKNVANIYHYLKGQPLRRNIRAKVINHFAVSLKLFYDAELKMTKFKFSPPPKPPVMTYCITGILTTDRGDMIKYLSKYNWEFSPQVSKYVDLLIVGENPGKTKLNKADYISCPMIKENEITKYLKKEK